MTVVNAHILFSCASLKLYLMTLNVFIVWENIEAVTLLYSTHLVRAKRRLVLEGIGEKKTRTSQQRVWSTRWVVVVIVEVGKREGGARTSDARWRASGERRATHLALWRHCVSRKTHYAVRRQGNYVQRQNRTCRHRIQDRLSCKFTSPLQRRDFAPLYPHTYTLTSLNLTHSFCPLLSCLIYRLLTWKIIPTNFYENKFYHQVIMFTFVCKY